MKAEARFVRAFLFFQATNWYGDVPFFTEDIDEATAKTISPTTQSEIVAWIHKELEEIAEILPTKEEYDVTDRGRITAGAAMAMNARIALNFNEWEKVVQYTEKLINTDNYGKYELFPDYQKLFSRKMNTTQKSFWIFSMFPKNELGVIFLLMFLLVYRWYSTYWQARLKAW